MSYDSVVLADSPVAFWELNESSGTIDADATGNHPGSDVGTLTHGAAGIGDGESAITLPGADGNYVLGATSKILAGLTNLTIEAWVKTTQVSGPAGACIYVERNAASGNDILKMEQVAGGTTLQLTYRDDAGTLNQFHGSAAINGGGWVHCVITKSGTSVQIYVNGVADGAAHTLTASNTFTNVLRCQLGDDPTNGNTDWNGSLAKVALYNYALTPAQVAAHFAAQFPAPPPTATTNAASGVAATSATLNGTVNPNGNDATVHFEYGTTSGYGTSTANQDAGSGSANVNIAAAVTGLVTGTLYHFRVVAVNAGGTSNGADQTFTPAAQPNIAIPPPALTRAQWEFILCDAGGNALAELSTAAGRTVAFKRNSYTEVNLTLSHQDDAATLLLSAVSNTGMPKLFGYRRGPNDPTSQAAPLRFRGYLAAIQEQSDESSLLTCTFRSPFAVLIGDGSQAGRFVRNPFGAIFNNTDAGLVAKSLIDTTNSDSPTGLATDPRLIAATVLRDRTYPVAQSVGQAIADLTTVLDGFDFFETYNTAPGTTDAFFNVTGSLGAVNAGARFEYGEQTLSNVSSVTRTTQPPQNSIFVTGGNGLTSTYIDAGSVAKYGEWWGHYDFSTVIEQATLNAKARGLCRAKPIKTVSFVPELALDGCPKPFDDFNLGDTVPFYANRFALQENAQLRINGFTIPISEDGYETASIDDVTSPEEESVLHASLIAEVV